MFAIAICIWTTTIGCTSPESIEIRKFSLTTSSGQNAFHEKLVQNALNEKSDDLGLNFDAIGMQFAFELQRISVFGPGAVVRIIDNVRGQNKFVFWQCSDFLTRATRNG